MPAPEVYLWGRFVTGLMLLASCFGLVSFFGWSWGAAYRYLRGVPQVGWTSQTSRPLANSPSFAPVLTSLPQETGDIPEALFRQTDGSHPSLAVLEEAVTAYRQLLLTYPREFLPLQWAMIQNNLGNVLTVLSQRTASPRLLAEAVEAYRQALEAYPREHLPLQWAMIQNNLGNALTTLGERRGDSTLICDALVSYTASWEAVAQLSPHYAAHVGRNAARARQILQQPCPDHNVYACMGSSRSILERINLFESIRHSDCPPWAD